MRLRLIALGCTLTGALGFFALPPVTALADNTVLADNTALADNTVFATNKVFANNTVRAAPSKATLTLQAPATVVYGANVVISGRLTLATGAPPAQTLVTVTRTGAGLPTKTFTEYTGTAGGFGFTDHNPAKARYTYTAVFAGNASATSANAAVKVTVETIKPRITVSSPVTDYPYGARVTITVTLSPTFTDHEVSLYATPLGAGRKLVATGNVNAKGKWYPTYAITRTTTFTAVFAGDAHNDPNSASRTLDAYAQVADRITGYYKTSRSGSGITYDIFHGSGTLTLYATVTPNSRGECLEPETEQYDAVTGWDAGTKYGCDKLSGTSHDTAPFSLSQAVGDRYRIRADYFRSANDTANLSTEGPWLYFIVDK